MFQALKRLFRKEERPAATAPSAQTAQPAVPQEAQRAKPAAPVAPAKAPSKAGAKAPPAAPAPTAPASPDPATDGLVVRIPLKTVMTRLPSALKGRIRQAGSANVQVSLPMATLVPQLAQGRVQITFGQLRLAVPAGVISDSADQDSATIDLPLPEILSQIPPHLLPRRRAQKTIEIPDEVAPVFGQKGAGVRVATKDTFKPTAPLSEPPPSVPPPPPSAPRLPAQPKLPAVPVKTPYRETAKPAPAPAAVPPPSPEPIKMKPGDLELLAKARAATGTTPATKPQAAPTPTAAKTPPPTPTPAPAATGNISIPVEKVLSAFPDALKTSLGQAKAQNATFLLPAAELEKGLKTGKVSFAWKTLRTSLQPASAAPTTPAADAIQVELPLPVVAPLFLASHKPAPTQKKVAVGQDIPDVFANRSLAEAAPTTPAPVTPQVSRPAPTPTPTSTPISGPTVTPPRTQGPKPAAAPQPAAAPIPVPAAAPPERKAAPPSQDIGEIFGQPGRKNWTPAEITKKTSELPGVGGALIVLQDGLLVAAQLPQGLDGETIAAFLPQMYGRMSQYTKELKFGDPKKMTFVIDDVPLKIYRGAGVFYTVLGRNGEELPHAHLDVIAAQLGSQSKA